ncbi:hypothetical protein ACWDTP_28855 [Mycobacterium sp. NPDC003449]
MSGVGDVAARLDEGRPAVEAIAEYVRACELIGYQNPDLTGYPGQIRDWYGDEDGLDLRALDGDRVTLAGCAASAREALRLQDSQLGVLADAWQGDGADAAQRFLVRHGGAAERAVAALDASAYTVAELRDALWRAVDDRVGATLRIEGRAASRRDAWLAAAHTLRTGLGDRDAASELIDLQVKPFVHNDIGDEWVAAMGSATAAVAAAYDAAVAALHAGQVSVFDIPGELGPSWSPPTGARVAAPVPIGVGTAATVPAGWASPNPPAAPGRDVPVPPSWNPPAPSDPQAWSAPVPPAAPGQLAPMSPAEPPVPAPAALPGTGAGLSGAGGGLSGAGSGLSGLGQQLADLFGGLIGSAADGLPDSLAEDTLPDAEKLDEPEEFGELEADGDDEGTDEDDKNDDEAEEADEGDAGDEETDDAGPVEPAGEPVQADPVEAAPPPPVAPTPPPGPAPVVEPPPPAEPLAASPGETPCEIAADELPQVGG